MRKALGFVGLALTVSFFGCKTSPTGRTQFIVVPDSQMNQMGADAFTQMKEKTPRETNSVIVNFVKCVATPIANQSNDETGVKNWEIQVFRDPTPNAFALPGGKIGVHTGMLPVAKTQGQLAAVLGHEVGHVIARHGNERVSQAFALEGGLAAVSSAMNPNNPSNGLLMGALGMGAQLGVAMPHGRKQESEADVIGIDLMAKAGFDPRESVKLWQNMSKAGGGAPPEFLSTHPSNENRIAGLNEKMSDAMKTYEKARRSGKRPSCRHPN
jgi:predicted Zn-dependent protease